MILCIDTNCILPGRVGGIEAYVIALIESLTAHASWLNRLEIVTRSENDALFRTYASERCGVHLLHRPQYQGRTVASWAELAQSNPLVAKSLVAEFGRRKRELLHQLSADVVHFPAGAINPIDIDVPAIMTIHDMQHRRFPQYFSQTELDDREHWWPLSARNATAVIADSHFAAGEIAEQLHLCPSKLFIASPPVRSAMADPAMTQLTVNTPERFILYPAAAWPHKNHHRLLKAMAMSHDLKAHLVLTGAAQESSNLRQWIDELNLNSKVHLLGRVDDTQLRALYHNALAMVFPSEYEGFGLPLLEAMACGCPVAASNAASIPGVVANAAMLFDPADPAAIATALLHMDQDADLRRYLSRLGRQRAALFTPSRFAADLRTAYAHSTAAPLLRAA